jgi:hypothetical protein
MKHRATQLLILAAFLVSLARPAFARPDFTGEWHLDRSRSDLGPLETLALLVRTVTHDDPRLVIEIEMDRGTGKQSGELRLLTQGEEAFSTVAGEGTTSSALWLGDHLLVTTTRELDGLKVKVDELWILSADGMTLRVDALITTPKGQEDLLVIFVKH